MAQPPEDGHARCERISAERPGNGRKRPDDWANRHARTTCPTTEPVVRHGDRSPPTDDEWLCRHSHVRTLVDR